MPANLICVLLAVCSQSGGSDLMLSPPLADDYSQRWLSPPVPPKGEFVRPDLSPSDLELLSTNDTPQLPGTRFSASWLAAGGRNGFGTADLEANHTWLLGYGDSPALEITPGVGMHFWSGPQALNLPPRVYDMYLDFTWRPWETDSGGLSVGLTPGMYGDFERVDDDTFQLTGWLMGNWRVQDNLNLLFGVAYLRQARSQVLPIGGLVWTPNSDTRVELLIPKPKVARRFIETESGSTWWFVAGQLGGGAWAVADSPTDNVLLRYSDLRLLLGVEHFELAGREWSIEAGYVFSRNISVDNTSVFSPNSTLLLQGSVAF